MEFIVDNLVWFIAGGVVILMTIIGYFAEKTDFGKKLSTSNHVEDEKPIKEKKIKKDKKTKNNEENNVIEDKVVEENNIMDQSYQTNNQDYVQLPIINEIPTTLEQQPLEKTNVDPLSASEALNTEEVIIPETVNSEPALVPEVASVEASPIVDVLSADNFNSNEMPIYAQSSTIDDSNIEMQPVLEQQPNIQPYQLPVYEEDTLNNTISDVLPSPIDDSINKVIEPTDVVEQPINIPDIFSSEEPVNNLSDFSKEESNLIVPETNEQILEDTPVIINDENVIPFEELAATMDVPLVPEKISIPEIDDSSSENEKHDEELDEEEDIWKF